MVIGKREYIIMCAMEESGDFLTTKEIVNYSLDYAKCGEYYKDDKFTKDVSCGYWYTDTVTTLGKMVKKGILKKLGRGIYTFGENWKDTNDKTNIYNWRLSRC